MSAETLHSCIRSHKLSASEVLGYFCMLLVPWGQPPSGMDQVLWDEALEHHYYVNDHHPQYYRRQRCLPTVEGVKDAEEMPDAAWMESILDMLAW